MSAGASFFLLWLREVVQPQADPNSGNTAVLDDFSSDGMREYCYPKEFAAFLTRKLTKEWAFLNGIL